MISVFSADISYLAQNSTSKILQKASILWVQWHIMRLTHQAKFLSYFQQRQSQNRIR